MWYNRVVQNLGEIPDFINYYENENNIDALEIYKYNEEENEINNASIKDINENEIEISNSHSINNFWGLNACIPKHFHNLEFDILDLILNYKKQS